MMTLQHNPSPSTSEYDNYVPGMSDEEELKRIGDYVSQHDGLGEEIYDDLDKQALDDLGLRVE